MTRRVDWSKRYVLVHLISSEKVRAHALATEASGYQRTPCGLGADALVFVDVLNLADHVPTCKRCFPRKASR